MDLLGMSGVDSVTSKLSAITGIQTLCVEIPINQVKIRKVEEKNTLETEDNYKNVKSTELELTNVFIVLFLIC